ncbi:endonuclease/exonuclease/phosphatase family protein [Amycolatopsis sp. NPDC098790]|uniref:endonuclease/exonuclease/phosphatase family protein n=1 Tax=Amycolatopsis sp. NPDC098790 TaxID=3363939 RepID=UPI003823C5E4
MPLNVLTLNVGNPAVERARRQRDWLARRNEDVLVLTETGSGPGTQLIAESYRDAGWSVTFPEHPDKERGVMLLARFECTVDPINAAMSYLPARLAGIAVDTDDGPLRILGAYVPSRDATEVKTTRKREWIEAFHQAYDATSDQAAVLLLGDLNVLEPGHVPPHPGQFAPFETALYTALTHRHGLTDLFRTLHPTAVEHSWARRAELGYRYDHAHASIRLLPHLAGCSYVHDTRSGKPALTDHSGLAVQLTLTATAPLITSDPAADHEATLF